MAHKNRGRGEVLQLQLLLLETYENRHSISDPSQPNPTYPRVPPTQNTTNPTRSLPRVSIWQSGSCCQKSMTDWCCCCKGSSSRRYDQPTDLSAAAAAAAARRRGARPLIANRISRSRCLNISGSRCLNISGSRCLGAISRAPELPSSRAGKTQLRDFNILAKLTIYRGR